MTAPTLSVWAFEQAQAHRFPPSVRLVLLALAKLWKDTPSIPDFVDVTGLCRRSVINAISTIEKAGLVEVERQPGGVSAYRLLLPEGGAITSANGSANGGAKPSRIRVTPSNPSFLPTKEEKKEEVGWSEWKPTRDDYGFAVQQGLKPTQIKELGLKMVFFYAARNQDFPDRSSKFRGWVVNEVKDLRERGLLDQPNPKPVSHPEGHYPEGEDLSKYRELARGMEA